MVDPGAPERLTKTMIDESRTILQKMVADENYIPNEGDFHQLNSLGKYFAMHNFALARYSQNVKAVHPDLATSEYQTMKTTTDNVARTNASTLAKSAERAKQILFEHPDQNPEQAASAWRRAQREQHHIEAYVTDPVLLAKLEAHYLTKQNGDPNKDRPERIADKLARAITIEERYKEGLPLGEIVQSFYGKSRYRYSTRDLAMRNRARLQAKHEEIQTAIITGQAHQDVVREAGRHATKAEGNYHYWHEGSPMALREPMNGHYKSQLLDQRDFPELWHAEDQKIREMYGPGLVKPMMGGFTDIMGFGGVMHSLDEVMPDGRTVRDLVKAGQWYIPK
jgi:hypothetical protein